eukprot:TRINITY_DN6422_c0_g1_i1.p1 TRINITY_DN6422_c0_g1~~TRINITY_DN6422_c0_g1_i1.p1  ORF type:complete len:105 (+),score=46.91 TRINITY_DN6422_c0_g1_i1:102-416(+)
MRNNERIIAMRDRLSNQEKERQIFSEQQALSRSSITSEFAEKTTKLREKYALPPPSSTTTPLSSVTATSSTTTPTTTNTTTPTPSSSTVPSTTTTPTPTSTTSI